MTTALSQDQKAEKVMEALVMERNHYAATAGAAESRKAMDALISAMNLPTGSLAKLYDILTDQS